MHVLAHDELKRADERSFERGDIHFAVALSGVAVAHFKESAGRVHGNVERSAGDKVFVIEIPRHNPRRSAVEAARALGRCVAHAAEKGMQRNLDARSEFRHHALFIQRNDFHFRVRIIVGQIATAGAKAVVGVRNGKFYGENFYFEDVAGFRAFDVNRPRENVPAGPFVLHLIGDVAQRLLNLIGRQPRIFEPLRTVRDQRLNLHRIARLDAQHRRRLRVVVAPSHGLRCRLQRVCRLRICPQSTMEREHSQTNRDQHSPSHHFASLHLAVLCFRSSSQDPQQGLGVLFACISFVHLVGQIFQSCPASR